VFYPPFCPYSACANHNHPPKERWWRKDGSHRTRCFGSVPRFQCRSCRRTFSTQTFSLDFYAKRRIDYCRLESLGSSSVSVRGLGRNLGCSCGSILNRMDRLARQSIACHARLRPRADRYEDVCIDGFVGFDRSQYFPNNITISITSASRFVLAYTHATLRRSGTTREAQKKRRDKVYRGVEFERKSLDRSFSELLDDLERNRPPRPRRPLVVITDEKLEYRRAFLAHRLSLDQDADHRVVHQRINSRLPRTYLNPLFPSNYIDREIRKDQAAHHRESTCFSRNAANGMSRMACYVGWHNYRKRYRIKAPVCEKETHAEIAGVGRKDVNRARSNMFRYRAFLSRIKLDAMEKRIWRKAIPTPGQGKPAYLPKFAVA
jgi:hypothetical protein